MPPIFEAFSPTTPLDPWAIAARLLLALAFGALVAAIYKWARKSNESTTSFPMTLVLLCVLIAMVTQVIGDNIARAFSLVGALSIVRFRTVVRDTKDTAYVILAVIAGMSAGAGNLWVAALGLAAVTLAEFLATLRKQEAPTTDYIVKLRAQSHLDWDALLRQQLHIAVDKIDLLSVTKNGAVEAKLRLRTLGPARLNDISSRLALVEGLDCIQVQLRNSDED
jgi:hypothetical protein